MKTYENIFINGSWVKPQESNEYIDVINPANEEIIAKVVLGSKKDVDIAAKAAMEGFRKFYNTSVDERINLLESILENYKKRYDDICLAISSEMGAPMEFTKKAQAATGIGHFKQAIQTLKSYNFEEQMGSSIIRREAIGVVGMITPWNWPINQITCKVAPALAAGCSIILKPSEVAPLNALILAEVLQESGVPNGVFNLINGTGIDVGAAISSHPDIDMVSFTGSTQAGISVAKLAADSVKRVHQELGGKSANILLDDSTFEKAVTKGVRQLFSNSGQSCNAPSRMLVPSNKYEDTVNLAKAAAEKTIVGQPNDSNTIIGPVANVKQFNKIQELIEKGINEGAELIIGGLGRPDSFDKGFYIKPTIFGNVKNNMTIAQEEIFGPVLCIIPYDSIEEAINIANDSPYGLSGYISSENHEKALDIASKIRSGNVHINYSPSSIDAPFGGYKQSGNGREWGKFGLEDFLEVKAILGGKVA